MPKKNIKLLGGFPLLAYSIVAAKLTKNIQRIMVSTDSQEIAAIANKFGAETPFIRPAEFSHDKATDYDVLNHAIKWLDKNEKNIPDFLVYLRPTTPLRDPSLIDLAIQKLIKKPGANSLRSGHPLAEPPQKMFQITKKGFFEGFFPNDPRQEYHNLPRQSFPTAFSPNGYVDIVRTVFLKQSRSAFSSKILAFQTPVVTEIDRPENFEYLEYELAKKDSFILNYLRKNFK